MLKCIRKILNPSSKNEDFFTKELRQILGFKPSRISIYKKAFTHRSVNLKDNKGIPISYERLEFLGDAMLAAIISHYLYCESPDRDEGYLTKIRSKIVSRKHLNQLGQELGLIRFVKSKIPEENFGENIHGNVLEALIGAIYIDKGHRACKQFIFKSVLNPYVDIENLESKIISYKSLIIEWCQKEKKEFVYDIYEDDGNEDIKHFGVKLYIHNKLIAKARATSKKKAEELVSKRAYYALQNKIKQSSSTLKP